MEWSDEVFANISNWMGWLKRGAACIFNRMVMFGVAFANISKRMECLKRGVVGIFNRMVMLGAAFAEWFHPEKRLGVALARDNLCSLS